MEKGKVTPKGKHQEYQVYRLPLAMRVSLSAVVFLFIILIVELARPVSFVPSVGKFIFFAVQLIALCIALWWSWQTVLGDRLVVSEDGIEFSGMGITGFVAWDNLGGFDRVSHGRTQYWGIRLRKEIPLQVNWIARLGGYEKYFGDFLPITHWTSHRWSLFGRFDIEPFRQTPLGQDLLHYALHLFEDEKAKRWP